MPEVNELKYKTLFESLKRDILSGKYNAENPIPSIKALMMRFGLSKNTVLHTLDELKHEGFISRRQGRASTVTKLGASRKIGIIIPGICYSEIFPPICRELSQLAQKEGYSLLFGDLSSSDPKVRATQAKTLARKFSDEGVSGIIFQPIEFLKKSDAINQEILSPFDASAIPVVLLDCDIVPSPNRSKYDIVGINNFEAGRRMAKHLREAGVRNAAFLMKPNSDYSIQSRFEGARSVFQGKGLRFTAIDIDPKDEKAVRRFLKRKPAPEAVVCRNDALAAHLLVSLRKIGKRIPDDVMVAGFNDVTYASIVEPTLTTIHLPCAEIARKAFGLLLARVANPESAVVEVSLNAPLVVRNSTKNIRGETIEKVGR